MNPARLTTGARFGYCCTCVSMGSRSYWCRSLKPGKIHLIWILYPPGTVIQFQPQNSDALQGNTSRWQSLRRGNQGVPIGLTCRSPEQVPRPNYLRPRRLLAYLGDSFTASKRGIWSCLLRCLVFAGKDVRSSSIPMFSEPSLYIRPM